MTGQNGFKSQLLKHIADHRAKRSAVQASIQKQLDELDAKIVALETALTIHEESLPAPVRAHADISLEELQANAKTQKQALKFIASRRGGNVHYMEARDILIAAKMTKGKARNVASHVYNLMAASDEWKWVSPGVFHLRDVGERVSNKLL